MTDLEPNDAMQSTLDAEMAEILDRYLQDRENGTAPPRRDWLAQNPRFADRLSACLDGIALFGSGDLMRPSEANSEAADMPASIGDYEILGELGRGGMGVVYEAREKSLDRIVALKVMRFGVVDPRALERFQREAETAGALHHTNIVPVYATGREQDTSWYAMQRIEGESLAHRIHRAYRSDRGPNPSDDNQIASADNQIPLDEILNVGIQSAEALDHAHRRDVVHRDVKPANLIIDPEDRVWLTDFGLARRLVDVGATMTGALLGTPRYMSPEQADFRTTEVDHRTDIYSLGATLYEMATGRPTFQGGDPLTVISKIRYEEPPLLRSQRGNLPRDLEVVLTKCLEKDSTRRYESAEALAEDLRAIREDRAIRARAITPIEKTARWVRKHGGRLQVAAVAVIATAATLLLSVITWQAWRESKMAAFRLRTAGGPYTTTIHPVGGSSFSTEAIALTVPMQGHQKLPIGDYDMTLAPRGRWSRDLCLPIVAGIPTDFRLRNEATQSREISIENGFAIPVAGFKEPAVLLTREGRLSRTTLSDSQQWSLDIRDIEVTNTALDEKSTPKALTSQVNFAESTVSWNEFFPRTDFSDQPKSQVPEKALTSPIDLDGDQLADTLVAAIDKPALLAIDSNGKVLWSRAYQFNAVALDDKPNRMVIITGSDAVVPGFIDLQDIGDRDGDGIHDLLTMIAQFRQPNWNPNARYRQVLSVQTEVRIVVLSGKTGAPIQIIQPPDLNASNRTLWPLDGIGIFSLRPNRRMAGIRFDFHAVRRAMIHDSSQFQIDWNNGRRTALPSPLQVLEFGDQLIAVYHVGNECRRYNLMTGEELGGPINVPFVPARRPTVMRLGSDEFALLYHEHSTQIHQQANYLDATRFIAFRLDGRKLWERYLEHVDWRDTTWQKNIADWPLARDVNNDGRDEFVIPMHLLGGKIGIRMLDASDGQDIWPKASYQLLASAEESLDRIELSADIDRDGWRDWAVASIAATPPEDATPGVSKRTGDAYVYVDWISGQTGKPLAWARHPIAMVGDALEVAEIDAIRVDLPDVVEVELVYGESDQEAELDSMVLRFHPSSPDPIAIAAGLDVCPVPLAAGMEKPVRVYHMRPGPFADGDERVLLLADPQQKLLRLGESKLIANWIDRDGRSLVAIEGFKPNRLIVVDANTLATVWSTERHDYRNPEFTAVSRGDGRVDFLVQWQPDENEPPTLINGDTGNKRWTASSAPGGHIICAHYIHSDRSLVIVGDGRYRRSGAQLKNVYSFTLSKVDAPTGTLQTSHPLLFGAPYTNYPDNFDDLQFVDVNGDGTLDVIGPDQLPMEKTLILVAWDGKSGQQLWARSLHRLGSRHEYYLPFCIIRAGQRPLVAYIGPHGKADQEMSLIVCDGETGDLRAAQRLIDSQPMINADRNKNVVAITECSPAPDHPRVGLLWIGKQSICNWNLFDVTLDSLTEIDHWQDATQRKPTVGVFLHDLDHDGVSERFVAQRYDQSERNGNVTYGHKVSLTCFDTEADLPTWELKLANENPLRKITVRANTSTAWLEFYEDELILIDLKRGAIIQSFDEQESQSLPILTAVAEVGSTTHYQLVVPSRDGVVTLSNGLVASASLKPSIHDEFDPRRQKRLLTQSVGVPSLAVILADAVRAIAAFLLLGLMPLWYFGTMIRDRQWSLSWLLLGPPVVLLMLMAGSSQWAHTPQLTLNLLAGGSWLLILAALYLAFSSGGSRDPLGGKAWLWIVAGTVGTAVIIFTSNYVAANEDGVRYLFSWQDAASLFVVGVCTAAWLFWPMVILKLLWARVQRRRARGATA